MTGYSKSPLFKIQLVLQVILSALVFFFPLTTNAQAMVCGVLLCTVGIPHGANDYLYRPDKSVRGMVIFLSIYIGTMALYALLWWLSPIVALLIFFIISFHHFGQSNFENESIFFLPSLLWGIWIIIFPVMLHYDEAWQIFNQMLSLGSLSAFIATPATTLEVGSWQMGVSVVVGLLYPLSLWVFQRENLASYFLQFTVVTVWYLLTPLLFGFIIVFCVWHSLQSARHQASYYEEKQRASKITWLKAMLPFSAIAIVSFAIYVFVQGFQISEAFILLSLITLPHVLIMHRLYRTNQRLAAKF